MSATLLGGPDRKEGLSLAYVKALAAGAGFSTGAPELDRTASMCGLWRARFAEFAR